MNDIFESGKEFSRRWFFRLAALGPIAARLLVQGYRVIPYSRGTAYPKPPMYFPWIAWVENAAGHCVAFVTKTGKLVWL